MFPNYAAGECLPFDARVCMGLGSLLSLKTYLLINFSIFAAEVNTQAFQLNRKITSEQVNKNNNNKKSTGKLL